MSDNNVPSQVSAATAIFNEHGEFIRIAILIHAHNKADIEDLYQEFYLELIRRPIPSDVWNIRGYLFQAVCHHVINASRRRRTYFEKMQEYATEIRNSINIRRSGNASIPDERQHTTVIRMARHLQERQAEAFLLKYRDECSILEIATRMGITRRTVSRYLSESVRKLRRRLAAE